MGILGRGPSDAAAFERGRSTRPCLCNSKAMALKKSELYSSLWSSCDELRGGMDAVRVFAISKLGWIKQQQRKVTEQEREPPREYLDRESHYLWGRRYLLKA